jgi:UDP-2-acetamido-2-deoxy-ribo-hexuluronate aminotransferase
MSDKLEFTETIQMYDPKREYKENKEKLDEAINNVLTHGIFINGPEIKELEEKLNKFVNVKHSIAVSNGTDALKIALLALDVKPQDEVITVSHTWISTAEVISLIGAIPVFIDIEEDTFNMNHNRIEEAITDKTKAIIVVSLYGHISNITEINAIANKYNIPVIEDGAQSFGAEYYGKKSCSLTTIGTTSFFPSKPLGCYGDGGACFTNDDNLAYKIRAIRSHGGIKRFEHEYVGLNGRLDTIQASILNVKLEYFNKKIQDRNNVANYYTLGLSKNEKIKEQLKLPKINPHCLHVWAQYSILTKDKETRDSIVDYMKKNKVNLAIFYPAPLHKQKCFNGISKSFNLEITESVCDRIFNLPCYAELKTDEQDYIISLLIKYFEK